MMKSSFIISWQFLTGLTIVFTITFIIFPGVTDDTALDFMGGLNPSIRADWSGLLFVFVFNIFDTIGRWLGG